MPTEGIVQIEVKAALTVRFVKTVIESRVCCSIDAMGLYLGKQKLEDLKVLYQYDIKEDSILQLKRGTIQILIKTNGGSINTRRARARVGQECEGHASKEAKNTSSSAKACV
ncbi:hypothetical protein RND71_034247 [Anisodus tanguticus]|uniref:Ubiquitin-like domain-containing protein n=1 Tax=Anisodus tanguticus TaxID=243964 RepID=A0AAE1RAC2_9SOLA|nr:hypothetical protein RND71_034247 [Anisodus tanguticus]